MDQDLIAKIIPPGDRLSREGFSNSAMLVRLTPDQVKYVEHELKEMLRIGPLDLLIVKTLVQLRSMDSVNLLKSILSRDILNTERIAVASYIYELTGESNLEEYVIKCFRELFDGIEIVSVLPYLVIFRTEKMESIVYDLTQNTDPIVSSNAKRWYNWNFK